MYTDWCEGAPGYSLVAVVILTLIGAVAMWHFVEKWFLFRSSHYVRAAESSELHSDLVLDLGALERRNG
jgi:peptidoglycan/LPS O-acetylase OafA/YrhL